MLEKSEMGDQERNYVLACQEAWRRRMGQLGERAKKENADFNTLANREQERLRSAISKCRNATSLRQVMIDFWSRGSMNRVLENNWLEVAKMFNNVDWRKGRDLALLALVSYKRPRRVFKLKLAKQFINRK